MFVCDKRDRAITCMLCRDLHSALMFSGFYKKICLKESDGWRKVISNKFVVTRCHTRFAVFFPLPSCCVSLLIIKLQPS